MRHGEGFLLVYSITDRDSFDSVSAYHQQILRVKDTESVPIVLVGNKCDLEDERRVGKNGTFLTILPVASMRLVIAEGRFIGEELGCRFVETSAKLGLNVTETVLNLVRQIRDYNRVCVTPGSGSSSWESLFAPRSSPLPQELLHLRRISRVVNSSPALELPGAGCWNGGCVVS